MIQRDKSGNRGTKSLKVGQTPDGSFRKFHHFLFLRNIKTFLLIIKAGILVQFRHTVHLVVGATNDTMVHLLEMWATLLLLRVSYRFLNNTNSGLAPSTPYVQINMISAFATTPKQRLLSTSS